MSTAQYRWPNVGLTKDVFKLWQPPVSLEVDTPLSPCAAELDAYNDRAAYPFCLELEKNKLIFTCEWDKAKSSAASERPLCWEGKTDEIVRKLRDRGPDRLLVKDGPPEISGVRPLSACLLGSDLLTAIVSLAASPQDIAAQYGGRWDADTLAGVVVDATLAAELLALRVLRYRSECRGSRGVRYATLECGALFALESSRYDDSTRPFVLSYGGAKGKGGVDMQPLVRALHTVGRACAHPREACRILMQLCCFAYLWDGVSSWMPHRFGLVYLMGMLERAVKVSLTPADAQAVSPDSLAYMMEMIGEADYAGMLAMFWPYLVVEGVPFEADLLVKAEGTVDVYHIADIPTDVQLALNEYAGRIADEHRLVEKSEI